VSWNNVVPIELLIKEKAMRFNYVKYDEQAMKQQEELKVAFEGIEALCNKLEDGRAKSLVMTKIEEAYMWTGKSIRDSQIKRGGPAEHIAERSKE
jgi:hypothetical protein